MKDRLIQNDVLLAAHICIAVDTNEPRVMTLLVIDVFRFIKLPKSAPALKHVTCAMLMLTLSSSYSAADWVYAKYSPWFWNASDQSWCYMPLPQQVWQNDVLVPNPLAADPFDVTSILDPEDSDVWITLYKEGEPYLQIHYTTVWNGDVYRDAEPPHGAILFEDRALPMRYLLSMDSVEGTAVFFIKTEAGYASLELDFAAAGAGKFTMLGNLGVNESLYPSWPDLGVLEDAFTVEVIPQQE